MTSVSPPSVFQPTLPARGATRGQHEQLQACIISTHAPRTGSDADDDGHLLDGRISTHAPRTGSDAIVPSAPVLAVRFQPTLPARGATWRRLI